jgi:membrane protein implicated in regulation of membrane protease activity
MFSPGPDAHAPGPLGKLLAYILGALLLAGAFMFSLVVLVLAAMAGSALLLYFWWKTRKLRREMAAHPPGGNVIEGEAVVVEAYRETTRVRPPHDSSGT